MMIIFPMMMALLLIVTAGFFFVFAIIKLLQKPEGTNKRSYQILAVVTGCLMAPIVACILWRAADVAFAPKMTLIGDGIYSFRGHTYVCSPFSAEEFPAEDELKHVGLRLGEGTPHAFSLLDDFIWPYHLYAEKNDPEQMALWEIGLMYEGQYIRTDE